MSESFYAGAYWSARKETAEACAQRAYTFLSQLARIDQVFSTWFLKRRSRTEARKSNLVIEPGVIQELFQRSRNRKDLDGSIIPELGFSLGLWNGDKLGGSCGLSVQCGATSEYVGNACVLDLPTDGEPAQRLLNTRILERLVALLVDAWDPDRAIVTSSKLDVEAGWLTYLKTPRRDLRHMPSSSRVVHLKEGLVVVSTDEQFSSSNPTHANAVLTISQCLRLLN